MYSNLIKQIIVVLTIVTFSFLIGSCSIGKKENDWTELKLNGKVKSIKEISYEAVYRFGEIAKGKKKGIPNSYINDKYLLFNQKGNKIEEIEYKSDGSIKSKRLYNYDDKNYLIGKNSNKSDGSNFSKSTYTYNEKGKLIENITDSLDFRTKTIFKYDNRNNLIDKSWYSKNGSLSGKYTYKYNTKDYKTEKNSYSREGNLKSNKKYKYDSKNNLVEENKYDSKGSHSRRTRYTYNEKGYLIEVKSYHSDGSIALNYIYKYNDKIDFDKKDNWIRKLMLIDDIPEYIIEREIIYF